MKKPIAIKLNFRILIKKSIFLTLLILFSSVRLLADEWIDPLPDSVDGPLFGNVKRHTITRYQRDIDNPDGELILLRTSVIQYDSKKNITTKKLVINASNYPYNDRDFLVEMEYGDNSVVTKEIHRNNNSEVLKTVTFTYNKDNLIEKYISDANSNIIEKSTYMYYENGKKHKYTVENGLNEIIEQITYSYDGDNRLIEISKYNGLYVFEKSIITYSKEAILEVVSYYDQSKKLTARDKIKFDLNDNLLEEIKYYGNGVFYESHNYKYNSSNLITEYLFMDNNGVTNKYIYSYDKNSNLLSVIHYNGSSVISKHLYTYNGSNKLLTKKIMDNSGENVFEMTNTYDKNGLLTKSSKKDVYKFINTLSTYHYNDKEKIDLETVVNNSNNSTIKILYKYDDQLNLINKSIMSIKNVFGENAEIETDVILHEYEYFE